MGKSLGQMILSTLGKSFSLGQNFDFAFKLHLFFKNDRVFKMCIQNGLLNVTAELIGHLQN